MDAEGFVTFLVVGLVSGWMAGVVRREGRHGLMPDLALGLAGSSAATAASWFSGVASSGVSAALLVAIVGASVTIACQRRFWPAPPSGRRPGARWRS
jgi:uncharacterized membrane protein YeaQ/YmgE (transglycosylase-associated protein family)